MEKSLFPSRRSVACTSPTGRKCLAQLRHSRRNWVGVTPWSKARPGAREALLWLCGGLSMLNLGLGVGVRPGGATHQGSVILGCDHCGPAEALEWPVSRCRAGSGQHWPLGGCPASPPEPIWLSWPGPCLCWAVRVPAWSLLHCFLPDPVLLFPHPAHCSSHTYPSRMLLLLLLLYMWGN